MSFVAVFMNGETQSYLEFFAEEWAEAYGVWLEKRQPGWELMLLSQRRNFDWQILNKGCSMWLGK